MPSVISNNAAVSYGPGPDRSGVDHPSVKKMIMARTLPLRGIVRDFAVVAVVVLIVAGCGTPRRAVEYIDLVADRGFRDVSGPIQTTDSVCWDETYNTIAIEPQQTITAVVELRDDPALHLAGSLDCGREFGLAEEKALLLGRVDGRGGGSVPVRVEFTGASGWWSHVVNLGALSSGPAAVELIAEVPNDCVVRLKDAYVEQLRPRERSESHPTQILLVSIDTLRADVIEDQTVPTPNLDDLALRSERWTRHYAAASWTKPSHASMLTGFAPQTHRALGLRDPMARAVPTLAQRFQEADFRTAAMVFDTAWLSPRWGFAKGFDEYRIVRWRVDREMRAAANWLIRHRDEPYFFFLHTFEPHSDHSVLPYEAPGVSRRSIADEFGISDFGCRRGLCASRFLLALDRGAVRQRRKDPEILHSTYDDGVRFTDHALGTLVSALETSGVWDDLLVVVTSDHGEAFGEHGRFSHSTLHEEIIRVPLLVKWPGALNAGRRNDIPTSSLDLAPTLLEHAGISAEGLPGTHLHRRSVDMPVFSGTFAMAAVRGFDKGIFEKSGDLLEYYDLALDPEETANLAPNRLDGGGELSELLRAWLRQSRALAKELGAENAGEVELSERERARLQAFGYLQ